jgi:hypothetical protein
MRFQPGQVYTTLCVCRLACEDVAIITAHLKESLSLVIMPTSSYVISTLCTEEKVVGVAVCTFGRNRETVKHIYQNCLKYNTLVSMVIMISKTAGLVILSNRFSWIRFPGDTTRKYLKPYLSTSEVREYFPGMARGSCIGGKQV